MGLRSRARIAWVALCLAMALGSRQARGASTGPAAGNANDPPSRRHCATLGCHVATLNDPAGQITLRLLDTATMADFTNYVPGQLYRLGFRISSGRTDRRRWGFQAIPLTSPGDAMAGTFTSPPINANYLLRPLLGRTYATHTATGTANGSTTGTTWTVEWRAPMTAGDVVVYVCGNAANGNGRNDGDFIACTTFVVQPMAADPDSDGDGLLDSEEARQGTDPMDADSDDDGLTDGAEVLATMTDPRACDQDGDTLPDGLEAGIAMPHADTDLGTGCFLADTDPATTTDPRNPDTDGDTCPDGEEDANANGAWDQPDETSPRMDDCPPAGPTSLLRLARSFATPLPQAADVLDVAPCTSPSDVGLCAEAVATVEDVPDPALPLSLPGDGTLVFIGYDSALATPGTVDVIHVQKDPVTPGDIVIRN